MAWFWFLLLNYFFSTGYNHLLSQPLKIRNQGFNNTLCVQLDCRAFSVNENYNSNPLCVNILAWRIKWNKMQMLRLFYSQRVSTVSIFIYSNHTAKSCLNFLIFSFIPELDAVSCFFHFKCVIQFWEHLKNSLGMVKILGVGPGFPELIDTPLCP